MKKLLILSILTLSFFSSAIAQITISGIVCDNEKKEALSNVLITIKNEKDNTVIKFIQTNADGFFSFSISEDILNTCMVQISYIGYKTQIIKLTEIQSPINILLISSSIELNEVVINAPKINQYGDTLVYNVASFANIQDKSIGDVLKKMPGVDVQDDGSIQYNGVSINKFYIEGKDLLEGRYGIATQGIPQEEVGSIEVFQNHQPIKVLTEQTFTDQAAINLRLKDKAKAQWVATLKAGGGYSTCPKGALWDAEIFAMLVKGKNQNLTTLKSNNTGKLIMDNTDFLLNNSENKFSIPAYINPPIKTNDFLGNESTRFNRSFYVSTSHLHDFENETQLKYQLNYLNNRTTSDEASITEYYLENGVKIVEEDINSLSFDHNLTTKFVKETNRNKFYLKNTLNADFNWNDQTINTLGSYSNNQKIHNPEYYISDDFQLIKSIGKKKVIRINAYNIWGYRPNRMSVHKENMTSRQTANTQTFFTNENISYNFRINRFYFDLEGGLSAYIRRFETYSDGIPDSIGILYNNNSPRYIRFQAIPKIEYSLKKIRLTLNLPMQYYNYSLGKDNPVINDILFSPQFRLKWDITKKIYTTIALSRSEMSLDMNEYYNGLILQNYRTLNSGVTEYYANHRFSINGRINYQNPIKGWFAWLMVMHSQGNPKYQNSQYFIGDYLITSPVKSNRSNKSLIINGRISTLLAFINGTISLGTIYTNNRSSLISGNLTIPYSQNSYNFDLLLNGKVKDIMNWKYQIKYGDRKLNTLKNTSSHLTSVVQNLSCYITPIKKIGIQLSASHYSNELQSNKYKYLFLTDMRFVYNATNKLEFSFNVNNLFNKKKYEYTLYDQLNITSRYFKMRGRELTFNILVKK